MYLKQSTVTQRGSDHCGKKDPENANQYLHFCVQNFQSYKHIMISSSTQASFTICNSEVPPLSPSDHEKRADFAKRFLQKMKEEDNCLLDR